MQTNIKVAVRVRPYNRKELESNQKCIIKVIDEKTLLFDPNDDDDEFFFQGTKQNYRDMTKRVPKKMSMEFDHVFDTIISNQYIFEECTAPIIESVLNGYNCSVFVYGATGAGKTFTMLGNESCPGLTFLTMKHLFDKMTMQEDTRKFTVAVSYLEVYNEQVMDLLTKKGPLKLREDSTGVLVSGLVPRQIYSAEELLELLALGNSNRTQHPTDANAESSRSHAVFQVHIRITEKKTDIKRTVKLSMIDLAGSERAASTKGIGLRFKEGASINKSLLALGNCINKLADGLKHIPYRDSNLTRILKDSLGGNCRTLMVANVSMSSLTYDDTYNTLKYASRAKKIRTVLKQNTLKANLPKDYYVKKVMELEKEACRIMETNKLLEAKIAVFQTPKPIANASHSYDEGELQNWYRKIDAVYSSVIKTQEYVIGVQNNIKSLVFHARLNHCAESYMKIFTLNKPEPKQIDWIESSINAINKRIQAQKEEQARWYEKLQDAFKDLEKLKREIKSSKCDDILQMYLKGKDLEIKYSRQKMEVNHHMEVDKEIMMDSKKLRQALTMSCELLQKCYHNICSEDSVSRESVKPFEKLHDFILTNFGFDIDKGSSSDENSLERNEDVNNITIDIPTKRRCLPANNEEEKYLQWQSDIDICNDNPNETRILTGMDSDWWLTQFSPSHIPYTSTAAKPSARQHNNVDSDNDYLKSHIVNDILSEKIIQEPRNKPQIKEALLRSNNFNHKGLLRTVNIGIQKENAKKSPVRVCKQVLLSNLGKGPLSNANSNLMARPNLLRPINGVAGDNKPIVRINRAATLRVKKF